ncbi:MAG: putative toxin-antitoxin system toxin component, PIN family [Gemmatimonadota bacterium]|jgi:putative PIN family toxin of toxin-antitoxin system
MTAPRVVLDSNVVVSALLFSGGRLAWMREAWRRRFTPLTSRATADELIRVLGYPKFGLEPAEIMALLGDYLPFAETVDVPGDVASVVAPDPDDQKFLDLAVAGGASWLVTGDRGLLAVAVPEGLRLVSPETFRGELSP